MEKDGVDFIMDLAGVFFHLLKKKSPINEIPNRTTIYIYIITQNNWR